MRKTHNFEHRLIFFQIFLLFVICGVGLLSFQLGYETDFINQYKDTVTLFGYGIYQHDSYFKAPIFIGSDATMLGLVVPLLLFALRLDVKHRTHQTRVLLTSLVGVVVYYATSIVFGVTYNSLFLLYVLLFTTSWITLLYLLRQPSFSVVSTQSTPLKVFLIMTSIALTFIWLMDIIPTLLLNTSLPLIEVYTTEITYVLDIGIISPLILISLYLDKKQDSLGKAMIMMILVLCVVMGVMLPVQTLFQLAANIIIPIPVLIIKVGIFVLLAVFALYFSIQVYTKELL